MGPGLLPRALFSPVAIRSPFLEFRKLAGHVVCANRKVRVPLVSPFRHEEDVVAAGRAVRVPAANRRPGLVNGA